VPSRTKSVAAVTETEAVSVVPEFVEELPPPSPRKRYRGKYADFADTLRENAGRWAKYPSKTKTTIYQLRKSRLGSFPGDEFEFEARCGDIYLRYVGSTTLEDILNEAEGLESESLDGEA
jgi:hypothetical protein